MYSVPLIVHAIIFYFSLCCTFRFSNVFRFLAVSINDNSKHLKMQHTLLISMSMDFTEDPLRLQRSTDSNIQSSEKRRNMWPLWTWVLPNSLFRLQNSAPIVQRCAPFYLKYLSYSSRSFTFFIQPTADKTLIALSFILYKTTWPRNSPISISPASAKSDESMQL